MEFLKFLRDIVKPTELFKILSPKTGIKKFYILRRK